MKTFFQALWIRFAYQIKRNTKERLFWLFYILIIICIIYLSYYEYENNENFSPLSAIIAISTLSIAILSIYYATKSFNSKYGYDFYYTLLFENGAPKIFIQNKKDKTVEILEVSILLKNHFIQLGWHEDDPIKINAHETAILNYEEANYYESNHRLYDIDILDQCKGLLLLTPTGYVESKKHLSNVSAVFSNYRTPIFPKQIKYENKVFSNSTIFIIKYKRNNTTDYLTVSATNIIGKGILIKHNSTFNKNSDESVIQSFCNDHPELQHLLIEEIFNYRNAIMNFRKQYEPKIQTLKVNKTNPFSKLFPLLIAITKFQKK